MDTCRPPEVSFEDWEVRAAETSNDTNGIDPLTGLRDLAANRVLW